MCKSKKTYLISILIPLVTGGISALLGMKGMAEYKLLKKPPLAPPGFVFSIVWNILFVLMGIGSASVYCSQDSRRGMALRLYATQLAVNFFWTIFFFKFRLRLFSFFWLIFLLVLVILMVRRFRKILAFAGNLQIPYVAWLLFAAYLNLGVWYLNLNR